MDQLDSRDASNRLPRIWLDGDRYNEAFLFDIASGKAKLCKSKQRIGVTAGAGSYLSRRFVAVYVEPDREHVTLQVDQIRYPLDGQTTAVSSVRGRGLYSTLSIERPGLPSVHLRQRTIMRAILQRLDPTYDALDEFMDDFAVGIAGITSSEEAHASYLKVKDPAAGPWALLT